jgi:uncharacterized phage infection (PIP) family protein YhgE
MSDKKSKDAAGDAPENVLPTTPTEELGAEDIVSDANVESSDATAEKITETLEQLLPGVLEIAEATNSAADVNRKSAAALKKGLDQVKVQAEALNDASEKSAVLASRVMIGAVSALVISVFLYGFIAFQLASRVTQVDSMLVAVSKRIVQMNSALNTFEQLRSSIGQLAVTQAQFSDRQMLLIEAVSRSEVSTRSLVKEVPDLAAQQVGLKTDQIATQVSSLSDDLAGQSTIVSTLSKSVGALGQQMKSLDAQVSNVKKLNADVEALIALERENYLDVLQRQVAVEEARQAEGKPVEPEPAPSVVVYPYISISK